MGAPKTFVRCVKMKDMRAIAAAGRHAWGADQKAVARRRPDAVYRCLVYTPADGEFHELEPAPQPEKDGDEADREDAPQLEADPVEEAIRKLQRMAAFEEEPEEPEPLPLPALVDYPALFRAFKAETGASERSKTTLALHFLVGVSPSWIEGDPHDPDNAAVRDLVRAAAAWVEGEFGERPWAVRYDTDERGAGIVDILLSPTSIYRNGRGPERRWISTNKSLEALRERYDTEKSYEALQDSWTAYAQAHLDPDFERGKPGGTHRSPEAFGAAMDAERKRLDAGKARLAKEQEELLIEQLVAMTRDTEMNLGERAVEHDRKKVLTDQRDLWKRDRELNIGERAVERDRAAAQEQIEAAERERLALAEEQREAIKMAEGWLAAAAGKR